MPIHSRYETMEDPYWLRPGRMRDPVMSINNVLKQIQTTAQEIPAHWSGALRDGLATINTALAIPPKDDHAVYNVWSKLTGLWCESWRLRDAAQVGAHTLFPTRDGWIVWKEWLEADATHAPMLMEWTLRAMESLPDTKHYYNQGEWGGAYETWDRPRLAATALRKGASVKDVEHFGATSTWWHNGNPMCGFYGDAVRGAEIVCALRDCDLERAAGLMSAKESPMYTAPTHLCAVIIKTAMADANNA